MVKISIFKEKDESNTPPSEKFVIRTEHNRRLFSSTSEKDAALQAWFCVRDYDVELVKPW